MTTQDIGGFGEEAAAEFLEEAEYEILKRNFRMSFCTVALVFFKSVFRVL